MSRKFFLVFALAVTLIAAALVLADNTYSGGVSGSVPGNALIRSTGSRAIGGSSANDDLTTFTVNTTPSSGVPKFSVVEASGNTLVAGTFDSTGAGVFASTLAATGNFAVNTNKFTVAASSGNTLVAGTFDSTGAGVFASTLGVTGNFAVATNKFTVAAATGNTTNAGTFTSTGAINGPQGGGRDLTTPIVLTAAQSGQMRVSASTADAVMVYTLPPASTAGLRFCFAADTITGSNREVDVEPQGASDLIVGTTNPAGATGIATTAGPAHGIKNTHASAVKGNFVCLMSDGTNTYYMTSLGGTWAAY